MKKFGKVLLNIFLVLICIFGLLAVDSVIAKSGNPKNLSQGFSGDTSKSGVVDNCGLFEDDPRTLEGLDEAVKACAGNIGMNVMVYIAGEEKAYYTDSYTDEFTDILYDNTFGEYTDGLIYYMDLSGKSPAYDCISKSGKAMIYYDDDTCEKIFKTMDYYLPSSGNLPDADRIRDGIYVFCDKLEQYNEDASPGSFKYEHDTDSQPNVYVYVMEGKTYITKKKAPGEKMLRLMGAEVIGAIVSLLICIITKSRYRFKSSTNPSTYVSREKSNLYEQSDVLIRSYVTKHKIESSSGGGGYRSGGGGGHGGSHSHSGHHR